MKKYIFRKYSSEFPEIFGKWKRKLSKILPRKAVIEHIGSTAVPGLGGKGIIDILILVSKRELPKANQALVKAGLEYKPHPRRRKQYFFQKDFKSGKQTFRAHFHLTESKELLEKDLAIVDFLKSNEKARKEYETIKKKAVKFSKQNGKKYRKFKGKFLRNLAKKSLLFKNKPFAF